MTQIDPVIQKIAEDVSKQGFEFGYEISFPRYRIIPDEVRLALNVLKSHGMKISVVLKNKDK